MKRLAYTLLALTLLGGPASARDGEGRLDVIVAPNNTRPVLTQAGQTFDALLREGATLTLESPAGSTELNQTAGVDWRGLVRVTCRLPEAVPAGAYTLVAKNRERTDRTFRAVHVYDAFPTAYTIAQFNDLRVGAKGARDTALYRITRRINAGQPGVVLVTGNLTADGSADEFRVALEVLNDLEAPTLVTPGAVDRSSGLAEAYLGPSPATWQFGRDGYLGYYTPTGRGDWGGAQEGRVYVARRSIRASRWSIGFTNEYGLASPMRDVLTLFVDDPLDVVIAGHAAAYTRGGRTTPWGHTTLFEQTSDTRGGVHWFRVDERGVRAIENGEP